MTSRSPKGAANYEVGYGKPPSAFKFGNRPQPDRSLKSAEPAKQGIVALLDRHAVVERAGRRARVHPHEAMITSFANEALRKNKISAAKQFLQACHKAGVMEPEPAERTSGVIVVPDTKYPIFEFLVRWAGLPPWDEKMIARAEDEYARDLEVLRMLQKQQGEEVSSDEQA